MKIRPVEAEMFHADTHCEAIILFSLFCEGAKNDTWNETGYSI